MANKHRGEVTINLGGRAFTLRPTFEALVEFEDRAGITAYEALRDMMVKQRAPAKCIAVAFHAGIKAAWNAADGTPPSFAEIGSLIQRVGIKAVVQDYSAFLTMAISSDDEVEAMRKAAAEADAEGKAQAAAS